MSEETIFANALQKPTPADRAAYLDATCAGDPGLRRRVEALLRAHEQSDGRLDRPRPDPGPMTGLVAGADLGRRIAEGPGTRIGPYRLLQPVGEGGMGA